MTYGNITISSVKEGRNTDDNSGKPSANLRKHLINPKQCPNVPREVQVSLRPVSTHELVVATDAAFPGTHPTPSELSLDAFEMTLTRILFVWALSFMLIEAKIFRHVIALVAPTMTAPARHTLSGVLLNRKCVAVSSPYKQTSFRVLVTVEWSDVNSSSIINFMVVAPGMTSAFRSSWSTRSEQHTAVYVAGEIDKVIAEIQYETTARVVAVVTDKAQNIRSASGRIQFQRPNTVSGGCSAHVLNFVMQDVPRYLSNPD
ncbi:LOW QUALITY PROTEIN: hypothetical protein PHMEG_00017188 [Phytophthora megakarya]|uniref:DUF659 domain-containing protein n=1 Tax=Phytophthora megakarya TaxID=4795 RepID=A0A225VWW1_9STRA|nr:LOW QUALITY PROTEIN: hypothetical protein PHMEG_00017188 [Phytophthora megakarya]